MDKCDNRYSLFSHALWDNGIFVTNIHKVITFWKAKTDLTGTEAAVQTLIQVILL